MVPTLHQLYNDRILVVEENVVDYHGWQWTRRLSGYIDTKTTPRTDHRTYHYNLGNNDRIGVIKNIVLLRLNKYLNKLEEQVDQEVPYEGRLNH